MTIEELRLALNISEDDDQYDTKIEALYALSKKVFTQYTRVELESAARTQTLVGFEGSVIYLEYTPFSAVTSINTYTEFNGDATEVTDYQVINNVVYFNSSIDVKYLEIVYTAGYSTIPEEIDTILVKILNHYWKSDENKVMISSSGEAILNPDEMKIPKSIRDAIAIYRVGV